jgi:competence protein ComEA
MIYVTKAQKYIFAVSVLILVIISGTIYIRQEKATEISLGEKTAIKEPDEAALIEVNTETKPEEISVYICGFVANPGVITVKEGTRLDEAVELLGEKLESASKTMPGVNTIKNVTVDKPKKVNINTAGESELDILEGVGPATAKAIIKYREQNGSFKSIEDIKKVKGIGDAKFDSMKDDITVE